MKLCVSPAPRLRGPVFKSQCVLCSCSLSLFSWVWRVGEKERVEEGHGERDLRRCAPEQNLRFSAGTFLDEDGRRRAGRHPEIGRHSTRRFSRPGLALGRWIIGTRTLGTKARGRGCAPGAPRGLMVFYLRVGFAGFFPPPSGCVINQNNLKVVLLLLLF